MFSPILRNIYRSILIKQIFKLLNNLNSIIYVWLSNSSGKESGDERYRYRPCPVSDISHGDEPGCIISAKGYNMVCEFLGANWYALVATVGLAHVLFIIHIIYAFWLTMQNRKARGSERYAVTEKPKLWNGLLKHARTGYHRNHWVWACTCKLLGKMQLPELMHNMGMHADTLTYGIC